jgi:hypothetical protein
MRQLQISIVALLAIALAGCEEPGELYQRPQAEVHDLLRTVEVPLYMYGSSTDTEAVVDGSDPAKMVWKITADEHSLMTFKATLIPDGEFKTRVVIDLEGSRGGRWGNIEGQLEKVREIRALYLASMTEAVDSTLDGRAYDISATYPALMSAYTANIGRLLPPSSGENRPQDGGSGR